MLVRRLANWRGLSCPLVIAETRLSVPGGFCQRHKKGPLGPFGCWAVLPLGEALTCEWVYILFAPASMPGDALLFQRLSGSTIGAVWFHGRVRDGIGWVTDAMVTKQ